MDYVTVDKHQRWILSLDMAHELNYTKKAIHTFILKMQKIKFT